MTNCCCHDDSNPSLSVKITDEGKILTNCLGCGAAYADIIRGLGFADVPGSKKPKTESRLPTNGVIYTYHDAQGKEELFVHRYYKKGETKKSMVLWTPTETGRFQSKGIPQDRKIPLYRLPHIMDKDPVMVLEGEKDCETILKHKHDAAVTTSAMGAGSSSRTDWTPLRGKRVTVCMDADDDGRKHADKVANILLSLGCTVDVYNHPADDKSDITDWIEMDGYKATLKRIKAGLVRQKPRKSHFDVGVEDEMDFSIEVAGRQIGKHMINRMAFFKGDYFMATQTHWERCTYDQQLRSQIAIDQRPRIIRELDERGWNRTKPEPDSAGFFNSPTLWGAFDTVVTRHLEKDRDALAVQNGVLRIENGEPTIRPFDPSTDTNTSCSPLAFEEPSDEAMLRLCDLEKQWLPGDDAQNMFVELISRSVFQPNHRRVLQILSPPATGKSTMIALLQRCFSHLCYTISDEAIQQKSPHNEGLCDLIQFRPRFILINESISKVDAGLLNSLTGGELQRAKRMRKPEM